MRRLLAGLILLLISSSALAQVKGEVESIGFGSLYRSNCWVPMVVRMQAEKSGIYQIRVKQEDLDRDLPEYVETVSLTGSDEGNNGPQRFWMYFLPQPRGLSDTTNGGTLRELQEDLRVYVCDEKGKEIAQLPVTNTITNVEAFVSGPSRLVRGNKLVVAVLESGQPIWKDYQQAIGTLEDVIMIGVRPGDLPEDVRGYQAVDALLWLRAAAPDPSKPSDERRYRAIQEYVRQGGKLVICQPPEREATTPWGDLLPVVIKDMVDRTDARPLSTWAVPQDDSTEQAAQDRVRAARVSWNSARGPFKVARADAKPGALVDTVVRWDESGNNVSPYIVRQGLGTGCVSWVAQDLSDPSLTRADANGQVRPGWPRIWDRVFDWKNDTLVVDDKTTENDKLQYASGYKKDLGSAMDGMIELTAKSRTLVLIAVMFFIAYWLVAGPGVYFFLTTKGRSQLSWFLFGASAIAATGLTVVVVKLIVRGDPELSHYTVIRQAPGQATMAISRFGLYIPQDGPQEIALRETSPGHASYVTAFPIHPVNADQNQFPAQLNYDVPIREAAADAPAAVTIPYRSTLKKMQAHWVGNMNGGLDGAVRLNVFQSSRSTLQGVVGNRTGVALKNVYIVYRELRSNGGDTDQMVYLPKWEKDRQIDLQKEFFEERIKGVGHPGEQGFASPEDKIKLQSPLTGRPGQAEFGWTRYFYAGGMKASSGLNEERWSDRDGYPRRSFPMLSLFDRLTPMKNFPGGPQDRTDLLRRGGREFDVSGAVCAGSLVVLAEADGEQPLPFPLEVNGKPVQGRGAVFYQFVLPLERSRNVLMTTQPSILGMRHDAAERVARAASAEVAEWRQ
ncbi:MAG TPA: hypothetical protein VF669_19875 [Tepidisphaeraceae bacterium]|jgi:hypothetical protein